jgi:hypothetical protein
MCLSHHQNADNMSKYFENAKLKYLGVTVINVNYISKETNRRLNSRIACHRTVQNVLFSHNPYTISIVLTD